MILNDILDKLEHVKKSGAGFTARCPAHEDKNPSLCVTERDGKILLKCQAGCSAKDICAAMRIELKDLFIDTSTNGKAAPSIVAEYSYSDETGKLLYQVIRYAPKGFKQRQPDGNGGWRWNLKDVRHVPYRLPEVMAASEILICEGEKDCETARTLGFTATCNSGGAGKWKPEYAEYFREKNLTIIADADEPGRKHAQQVAASLQGKASSVKVIEFPDSKDLSEWVERGGTREKLLVLIAPTANAIVDGAVLIRSVETFISQFVILPPGALLPIALWAVGTHCYSIFEAFAYLNLTSPTPRCGKTRTCEVIEFIVARPLRTSSITEAALFRAIEHFQPTMMIDEAEMLTEKTERAAAIRAVLNAGNRANAHVVRCVGKDYDVTKFAVFCPKIIAGIGATTDTITDRSIKIEMQRARSNEKIARFLIRHARPEGERIRELAAAFMTQNKQAIEDAYGGIELPFLEDRDAEAWEPLFAILNIADESRCDELRACALALTGQKAAAAEDESLAQKLLLDCWKLLDGHDAIASAELVNMLKALEESPWADMELNQRKLARRLKPFQIVPCVIRVGTGTPRGYRHADFIDAVGRYSRVLSATSATA